MKTGLGPAEEATLLSARRELAVFLLALGPDRMAKVIEEMELQERLEALLSLDTFADLPEQLFFSWLLHPELISKVASEGGFKALREKGKGKK